MLSFLASFVLAATPTSYTVVEPKQTPQSDIQNNGGSVMANDVNVYAIYYGNHSSDTKSIIKKFVTGLSGSDWWGVVQTYYGDNGPINSVVTYKGEYQDDYSLGKSIPNGGVSKIINAAVKAAQWPLDKDGIYVVFTSADVTERSRNGAFCKDYCGYHGITSTTNLKLSMVGDAVGCPGSLPPPGQEKGIPGCMQRYYRNQTDPTYSVNKNQHADSMANVLAHELAETASDYDNTWRDRQGQENGDKCGRYFVDVKGIGATSPYDGAYNVDFGVNGKYLIQSMWSAKSQSCVLAESNSTITPMIRNSLRKIDGSVIKALE